MKCPICNIENPPDNSSCQKCGFGLSLGGPTWPDSPMAEIPESAGVRPSRELLEATAPPAAKEPTLSENDAWADGVEGERGQTGVKDVRPDTVSRDDLDSPADIQTKLSASEEPHPQEIEALVQELQEDAGVEGELRPQVDDLLRDLRADSAITRFKAADQLGKLSLSSASVVRALITAQESESDSTVRWYAARSLRAPVHQEVLQQHPDLMKRAQSLASQATAAKWRKQWEERRTLKKLGSEDESGCSPWWLSWIETGARGDSPADWAILAISGVISGSISLARRLSSYRHLVPQTRLGSVRRGAAMTDESSTVGATTRSRRRLADFVARHPVWLAAFAGATASLVLPVCVVAWKASVCNYGWDTDFSGVCMCLPPFVAIGAGTSALGWLIGVRVGRFFEREAKTSNPYLIGGIAGGILGAVAGLVASIVPAVMLMFPEC
jgi:hypothetical protein